jgi:hypothetical protein
MKGDRKIAGYVKAYWRHKALAARYQAKLDALRPLKLKVDTAMIAVLEKRKALTGGEMHRATTMIVKDPRT